MRVCAYDPSAGTSGDGAGEAALCAHRTAGVHFQTRRGGFPVRSGFTQRRRPRAHVAGGGPSSALAAARVETRSFTLGTRVPAGEV